MTMPDHVYRIIQVAGSSGKSIEDAIQNAVGRASSTLGKSAGSRWLRRAAMSKMAGWRITKSLSKSDLHSTMTIDAGSRRRGLRCAAAHPFSVAGTAPKRIYPTQRGPPPDLPLRREDRAPFDRPHPQRAALRSHGTRVDGRAAIAPEGVAALVAALGSLHANLWGTAAEHEMRSGALDLRAIGRTDKRLAVGAVADGDRVGIEPLPPTLIRKIGPSCAAAPC
jgi:Dodecin